MQRSDAPHEWCDAWILFAILLRSRPNDYATLESIVAAADYINHAIPTAGEMDGALHRLLQRGWIEQSGLTFAPSEAAETMYAARRGRRTAVHTDLEFIRAQIGASEWSPQDPLPPRPEQFATEGLTEQAIEDAYRAYRSRMKV